MQLTKVIVFLLILMSNNIFGQKENNDPIEISMESKNWKFEPSTVTFIQHKSRSVLKILDNAQPVILKNLNFTTGIIEYDFEALDPRFASIYFRRKDAKENECFYFRTQRAGNPLAVDAIQYAPHLGGVNLWDMLFHFQSNANFKKDDWNHVKLVISEKQMWAYVNDMDKPALTVDRLEGNVKEGAIAFDGQIILSNLKITPNVTEGLPAKAGEDPTLNDPRYLRKWQVSSPMTLSNNVDFDYAHFPNDSIEWTNIEAETRGLVNLTRKFGEHDGRQIVWLRTSIKAATAKTVLLQLGFSDDVWVFINKRLLYVDKNSYGNPIMKSPNGRCSIDNTSFEVPFGKGENELLIGVLNDFYGWGIIARLNSLADLEIAY